jgi:DNA (cytosine-5)-methyltransferase 1
MKGAYYNEFDPKAAAWLRELVKRNLIAPGEVDERSIAEIQPSDLNGFVQCHFFAGIGGWSYALRLAGWPDDQPVWTGSCPCQDFSLAGKQAGFEGDRDWWPTWKRLIEVGAPHFLFGEQVDDSPEWIDRTANDLEALDYTFGACVVPAYTVGILQERSRFFFGAHAAGKHGRSHDRVVAGGIGGPSLTVGRLFGPLVSGGWWQTDAGAERLPTLCRNFNGLSTILRGFGNAIVPEVAAEFIRAFMEAKEERPPP